MLSVTFPPSTLPEVVEVTQQGKLVLFSRAFVPPPSCFFFLFFFSAKALSILHAIPTTFLSFFLSFFLPPPPLFLKPSIVCCLQD